ncbi:MAG: 16S rRNA (cytidine(1402)-2'-O)-methyltransferase [Epulopiscium sp. Nele67-Bin001]|nr:MAG: 16S rRNA (cytidine(1402)-2'-O)-methyltransferase [Epulopiscium sp. Nuni2H_MBin001]OON91396.1 MAG: 16S rRNA (cytidine(1402)-2'-O)-methyltransferase [Epulopiscium sp. Nele67-Bin001]
MYGTLILCATPIGNLEDITYRTVRTLTEVDYILAEDTRHTKKLLSHFDIHTPLTSYHEHNKLEKAPRLIEYLKEGKNLALVTDAGTPGISDPGEDLVRMALEHSICVTSTPGAVAAITALVISGKSTRRFVFEGFLPADKKEKAYILDVLKDEVRTIVLYEAPHRLVKTLQCLEQVLEDRAISVVKELTKKHESILNTTISDAIRYFSDNQPKGEYVLVIDGKDRESIRQHEQLLWQQMSIEAHLQLYVDKGMAEKDAMKQVAKDRGVSKRDIYAVVKH